VIATDSSVPRAEAAWRAGGAMRLAGVVARIAMAAALAVAAPGCGTSVLIHRDDVTYRGAIDHFQRTRQLIAASLAPDEDQAIFLQAEGFFRYRFAPPGRSVGSYLAQATASIIDLPVLDSLAGSLDLYSLRIRTNDAAVQLWESLLERNPASPLRPLTLYRLGWAYRNAIASGFPGSSDQAFDELAKLAGSPLAPLAAEARRVPWKSQGAATAWSIVPGLGQMYAGEVGNGAIRLTIALAAAAAIIVPSVQAYERGNDLSFRQDWPLLAVAVAGASVLAIDYSSSYKDAQRAALELNERQEAAFEARQPAAP
jgi:hypothetical protein